MKFELNEKNCEIYFKLARELSPVRALMLLENLSALLKSDSLLESEKEALLKAGALVEKDGRLEVAECLKKNEKMAELARRRWDKESSRNANTLQCEPAAMRASHCGDAIEAVNCKMPGQTDNCEVGGSENEMTFSDKAKEKKKEKEKRKEKVPPITPLKEKKKEKEKRKENINNNYITSLIESKIASLPEELKQEVLSLLPNEASPPFSSRLQQAFFEVFWKKYPRKVGKGAAKRSFAKKIKSDAELFAKIISALEAQKKSKQWQKDGGQFIPYPATWLNQERWEDEVEQDKKPRSLLDDKYIQILMKQGRVIGLGQAKQ